MELTLFWSQACDLAIRLHEMMQHIAADGHMPFREKKIRRLIYTCPQVRPYSLQHIWLHGVHSRDRSLQPVNADSPLLGIHISPLQQSNLRRPQPVPIRHEEYCLVPLRANDLKQLPQLVLREKVNGALLRTSDALNSVCLDSGR